MKINFKKYQGTGNDFIMINNMKSELHLKETQVADLCHRKFGIGADGLILIEPSEVADFNVNYFNSDGSKSFCGNGSRCSVKFAIEEGIVGFSKCSFQAIDGVHTGELIDDLIRISMRDVKGIETHKNYSVLNTGSPHYVTECTSLDEMDIITEAQAIRYNDRFRLEGINVNFIQNKQGKIHMRTYERGVEGETLSCGTGVTAVALSSAEKDGSNHKIVQTLGGELLVDFLKKEGEFTQVYLTGPADEVFTGEYRL